MTAEKNFVRLWQDHHWSHQNWKTDFTL